MLARGTWIAEKYELEHRLGKGGMGEVWLARHIELGDRRVAIKFLVNINSEDLIERFRREAQIASKIRTRHVVEVVDYGEHRGAPFIVMEHLDGRELRSLLEERGRLDPISTMEILIQAAKGLQRAHDAGLIHRDIKPENLFLTRDEDGGLLLKILDFGIAKSVETGPQTATGAMMGTVYYMSPEQFQGAKGIDHRTDLWSLACVAYEMLVGERVFIGDSVLMIGMQLLSGERPVPSRRVSSLPRSFDKWFAKALHPELDRRFESAQEMMSALATALGVSEDQANLYLSTSSPIIGADTSGPVSTAARRSLPLVPRPRRSSLLIWLPVLVGIALVTAVISFALRPKANESATTSLPLATPSAAIVASATNTESPVGSALDGAVALADRGHLDEAHLVLAAVPKEAPLRRDERFVRVENAWADRRLSEAHDQTQETERARMLEEVVGSGADEERRARAARLLELLRRSNVGEARVSKASPTEPKGTSSAQPISEPTSSGALPSRF